MESPYNGRATINEEFDQLQISIPPKRYIFIIVFMSIWFCGWFFGGVSGITAMMFLGELPVLIALIFLMFWSAPCVFVGRILWWLIAGKEIIEIGKGVLHIQKKGLLFSKPKTYDLNECKSFRTQDNSILNNFPFFGFSLLSIFKNGNVGTIAFDYGMKTIKFADGIDEAEGKHILNVLKEKGILKDNNL